MDETADPKEDRGSRSRALVPVTSDRAGAPTVHVRPRASFVTQLLSCQGRVAAYRERRRTKPVEAVMAYEEAEAPAPVLRPRFERIL
jgi:hypothetical protein